MPPSTTSGQAEDILDELIQIIRQEYDNFCSELCETDRKKFQRFHENLHANVRARLSEKRDLPRSTSNSEGEVGSPKRDVALSLEPGNPTPAASPEDRDYTSDISEAINTPLKTSSGLEPRNDSSIGPRRRTPPPPPSPREAAKARLLSETAVPSSGSTSVSSTSSTPLQRRPPPAPPSPREEARARILSDTAATRPGSASSTSSIPPQRRPPPAPPSSREEARARVLSEIAATRPGSLSSTSSIPPQRRPPPAPPSPRRVAGSSSSLLLSDSASGGPGSGSHRRSQSVGGLASPQSRVQSPIIIGPSPLSGLSPSNPAIPQLTRTITMLVSEILKDMPLPNQTHGRQGRRSSEVIVTKANCVDISGSNVDGLTMNNGGSYNSGSVIHKMSTPVSPQRVPRY